MNNTCQVVERYIASLRPYARNARTHSKKQIKQIARSIERFGFTNPVLVSDEGEIIAGHGRVEAAKLLGWKKVPTIALSHLSEAERRAYVIADNKLALNAGWDKEILAIELQALVELDFDVELTGFSLAEIDLVLDEASDADPVGVDAPEDEVSFATGRPVSRQGDLWLLGRHRLLCGDARSAVDFEALLQGEKVDLVFTDPPYNVKIDGNVCGLGSVRHREFAFASGEMSESEFTRFLVDTLGNASASMRDGAIAYVCMDCPRRERVPERRETIAAVEGDRLHAFMLPQRFGGLVLAILEGVEALARASLKVQRLQQILDRRIFGGVADKDDLESREERLNEACRPGPAR